MPSVGNALNIQQQGLQYFDGTSVFTGLTGDENYVMVSNGPTNPPSFQPPQVVQTPWTDQSSNFNVAVNNGYFVTATSTASLPPAPAQGNFAEFAVDSSSGILTIQANTGQKIRIGTIVSASAGTCASNFNGDSIKLVFRASDSTWFAVGDPKGTWTIT
jgi:hypothetical protein